MSANESHGRVGGSIAWASSVFVLTLAVFAFGYYANPSNRALLALTEGLACSAHATLHGLDSPTQVHFAPHTNGQLEPGVCSRTLGRKPKPLAVTTGRRLLIAVAL